ETGIGAGLAPDADLGLLGKGIFKPKGKPVSVRITHHHDLDRGILARRGRWRVGVIRGLLLLDSLDFSGPFPLARGGGPFSLMITPRGPIGDHPRSPHRDCTAAAHKDCTAPNKDCTAAAVAVGARPMNFPRTAHWQEAKEQSSGEPRLPLGQ